MSAVMPSSNVRAATPDAQQQPQKPVQPAQPTKQAEVGLLQTRVGRVLTSFRREFIWVAVFSAIANVLMLTPTIYMLQLFDRVMSSGNVMTLVAITALMLIFTLVMGFSEWVRARLLVRAGSRFDEVLNRNVFDAAFAAQLSNTRRNPLQPLNDLNQLRQFMTGNGVFAVADTPWTLIFIAALFLMHPLLGWLSVAFCVVQLALGFILQSSMTRGQRATQEAGLDSAQYLQAKLRNAETVESMGMLDNLRFLWMALDERHHAQQSRTHEFSHRVQAGMKWLQYTQQALMLSLGALLVMRGEIGPGAMIASNALMGNALRPVGLIVGIWSQFVEARAAFDRLNTVLDEHPEVVGVSPPVKMQGQVTVRDLKASAAGRERPILHGLNAEFKAGEVVAIIGPSGAGKSTLARCLLGIWPQTEGEVLLDGRAIQGWTREDLGPNLGYLPQDVELFEGTIAENISRFADVSPDVVIVAAKSAGIHEMVLNMPKGYDTPIGEAGGTLSGGQRQRLGLARAILGSPALVVLDEPSANLDDQGEAALLRVVRELKAGGSTVFMVVHQQQLLTAADRVLVMEAGQIKQLANIVLTPPPAAQTQQTKNANS